MTKEDDINSQYRLERLKKLTDEGVVSEFTPTRVFPRERFMEIARTTEEAFPAVGQCLAKAEVEFGCKGLTDKWNRARIIDQIPGSPFNNLLEKGLAFYEYEDETKSMRVFDREYYDQGLIVLYLQMPDLLDGVTLPYQASHSAATLLIDHLGFFDPQNPAEIVDINRMLRGEVFPEEANNLRFFLEGDLSNTWAKLYVPHPTEPFSIALGLRNQNVTTYPRLLLEGNYSVESLAVLYHDPDRPPNRPIKLVYPLDHNREDL